MCLAGGLELPVEALQLVVHPVDVGRQRAELVAVRDVDTPREVPGGDGGEPGVDPLDRSDQRPREHEPEQECEDDRPDGGGDEEVSRARVRARVLGGQGVGLRSGDVRELGCTLVEGDRERLGSHSKRRLSRRAGLAGFDEFSHDPGEPLSRRPDPLEVDLVLGRWPEQQVVGERRGRDQSDGARDRLVDRQADCVVLRPVQVREVLVEVPADVLRLQQAHVGGVGPELAVGERSLLEGPQRLDALVRLAEQAKPEHSQDDHEQGGAHERDEELGVHPCGKASDRADEPVVGRAQQPASRAAGCRRLLRHAGS